MNDSENGLLAFLQSISNQDLVSLIADLQEEAQYEQLKKVLCNKLVRSELDVSEIR